MKRIVLLLAFWSIVQIGTAQCGTPGWICMENGTFTVSDGFTFSDDNGGAAYSDNNYTITLCPDTPGDVVQLTFSAFALQTSANPGNSDNLSVYDGNSTAAPSLGDYSGTSIQGLPITGTVNNTSGCLTLVFSDNSLANTTFPGFEAQIICTTPCANPTSASLILSPEPDNPAIQTVNVCMNTPVTFGDVGSFAEPTFSIAHYIWNFDDGTIIDNPNANDVQHSFTEPGEYIVTLTVEDDNLGDDLTGCQSLNIIPLQVLVSTFPTFSGMTDLETCLGETVIGVVVVGDDSALPDGQEIGGGASGTTWTALPPQVVAGVTYLADGAGFSYASSLVFDFFEADAVLEDCAFLTNIFVNMEHSYMGDLGLFITCPNGTSVDLVEWGTNGGGGTYIGEAIDDENTTPGVGYDYFWTSEATNGTWGENSTGVTILPSGTYEPAGDLCDLVGCPLNGEWSFSVTDNIGIDNGYIFAWGIEFDPSLYPGVTTFTPHIGAGPDSSYWVVSGPGAGNGAQWVTNISDDADEISITPDVVGVYDYTYVVLNSFGCQFDTTIQVTIEQAPLVTAGADQLFSCGVVQLEGGLLGEPAVGCAACGVFDYCYGPGVYQQTYCPDIPGEGLVSITFLSGSTVEFNDYLSVYDGPDTWPSPYIGGYTGDLSGLSWTSTSPSGCLTIYMPDWDGVGNCVDGTTIEWNFVVSAGSAVAAGYVWEWDPGTGLDFNNIPMPTVLDVSQTTTYTLFGYPAGHPLCVSSDEVVVSVDPLGDPGEDTAITICSTDAPFDMLDQMNGTPVSTGFWYDDAGVQLASGTFDPSTDLPGFYEYRVAYANCEASAVLSIQMALPTVITAADDSTVCEFGSVNLTLNTQAFGQAPFTYSWTYDNDVVSSIQDDVFTPDSTGTACIAVTDACGYVASDCFDVIVKPAPIVVFTVDTTDICWPHTFELTNQVDPSLYTQSKWEFSDGAFYQNTEDQAHDFEQPGSYSVTLTVTNELGCAYSETKTDYLKAYASPIAGYTASPQPTDIKDTEIHFTDATTGDIAEWFWSFKDVSGSPMGVSTLQNPIYEFPTDQGGEYPIQLKVTDIHNCVDYVSGIIDIDDIFSVFIPNSFTPNADGVNDVLFVKGADIDPTRFSFIVFNRWGDKVFETNDYEIPWVGDVKDGEYFAPNGTYNWIAVAVSESTGVKKEFSGYVNIMR